MDDKTTKRQETSLGTEVASDRGGVAAVRRPLDGVRCVIVEGDDGRAASAVRILKQAGATVARARKVAVAGETLPEGDREVLWLALGSSLEPSLFAVAGHQGSAHRYTGLDRPDETVGDDHRLVALVNQLGFTGRQREVFAHFARGVAPKDIASRLGVSDSTIRFHLRSLYKKIGVRNQREALARSMQAVAGSGSHRTITPDALPNNLAG